MLGNRQVTDWFLKEDDICISVGSFFNQTKSKEYHITLEDCVCWGITFKQLQKTFVLHPEFLLHGMKISNRYYEALDDRSSFLKGQTPENKYEWLIGQNPDYTNRIKIADMASYLDVGERTFKAIKAEFLQKDLKRRRKPGQ